MPLLRLQIVLEESNLQLKLLDSIVLLFNYRFRIFLNQSSGCLLLASDALLEALVGLGLANLGRL